MSEKKENLMEGITEKARPGLYAIGIVTDISKTKKEKQRVFLSLGRDTISVLTERVCAIGETIACRINSFDSGALYGSIE